MKSLFDSRKKISVALLVILLTNLLLPELCLALTSGPTTPETTSFQPAGVSDMVDTFTGGFKYNIPLMDVDGYPINLNYQSGTGMDDEASWTGLGWNVNVGAINRQVRGVPDDMSGDVVNTDHYTKPKVTIGGRVTGKFEGFQLGKLLKGSGSIGLGIFNDNYTGIGADVSANAGISLDKANDSPFTAGLGLGINSSTASGVDVSPSMNLGIREKISNTTGESAGLSASLGYNSRSGLKNLTLGSSFNISKDPNKDGKHLGDYQDVAGVSINGSAISFNTEPILPDIQIPYRSRYGSFSFDVGVAEEGFYFSIGGTGYKSVRSVVSEKQTNPSYGFMYAERGKNQKNAMMDFVREKENPIIPELPDLALPVATPDLFSFTSQTGSGQFRLYRGGSGAFFDNGATDDNSSTTLGGDLGFGSNWGLDHAGVTWFHQGSKNTNRKWTTNNNYLPNGDFQNASYTNPSLQHMYFKLVGEKTMEDASMVNLLHDVQPLAVSISGQTANAGFTTATLTKLQKQSRAVNQTVISYLTAAEAALAGLDKQIYGYPLNTYDVNNPFVPATKEPVKADSSNRWDSNYHQKHHISEITVTDGSGKRMIYGLPVYNVSHTELSFAIGVNHSDYNIIPGTTNLINVPTDPNSAFGINHTKGVDNYFHAQSTPAYASSFLLTAVVSPDYMDLTGNGISDDDPGTAIKFNYSHLPYLYKWRTPFNGATVNRALIADKDDDKASIVYGEKELWYISSIESKTKVAYFITQDRRDALGASGILGTGYDPNNKQKCLTEIRLYSKADLSRPIKVVKFEYSYELCRGVPNNADGLSSDPTLGGKLTLKKVYFEYGNSPKGANYPYQFTYQNSVNGTKVMYGDMLTDRWGVYKTPAENLLPLQNDEFPYTNQDVQGNNPAVKSLVDQNAALWHLSGIQLPTGGAINVTYESNDYGYVQDKRAMVMAGIAALTDAGGKDLADQNDLADAKGLRIQVPNSAVIGDPTQWFKNTYLNGANYLYTKFSVQVETSNNDPGSSDYYYDFIPSYSPIQSVSFSNGYALVILQDRVDKGVSANPIIFSAWQKMKDEYPRYAYPGYDQRTDDSQTSSAIGTAVKAILSSIGNLSELTENFYQKCWRKKYASNVQLSKSFVRLVKQDGRKLGGGVRVKQIQISDSWHEMAGNNDRQDAGYGQAYSYTTIDNGTSISSGVASYEPAVGNDENPLKQPVPYVESIKGAVDDFFDLEEPFGESFFPAPSVGYSKVTVTDLDKNGDPDPTMRTGYSVNEFYTAKDYPVQVTVLPPSRNENKPKNYFSFLGATSIDEVTMSQGYSIELNDMHGKPKAERTFNQSGAESASTLYYYNSNPKGADEFTLNNNVSVVNQDGSISTKVLGRDIDFFTDFREFESKNSGRSIQGGYDVVGFSFFSIPIFCFPSYDNSEYKLFRSAVAVKVSQLYGIIDKVVKTQNGSQIITQNLAFDGLTGEPVVTQTQNEFENLIYSTSIPAYWVYSGMSGAYQNAGILLQNFTTDANAQFPQYASFLTAGDEIVDLLKGTKYWVINDIAAGASAATLKLIDINGLYVPSFSTTSMVKLVRSGYRNILNASTETFVSLNNPIQNNQLSFATPADQTAIKVINASATTYNSNWSLNQNGRPVATTPQYAGMNALYGNAVSDPTRGNYGTLDVDARTSSHTFLDGELNVAGIWSNPTSNNQVGNTVDIETDIQLQPGDYYIGSSGEGSYNYAIDGVSLDDRGRNVWAIQHFAITNLNTATPTTHHLSLKETLSDNSHPGAIGLEIYPHQGDYSYVFSTANLANVNIPTYVNRPHINPFIRGLLGNWRPYQTQVFQQSRNYNTNAAIKGVNVKSAGYINNFSPYWYYGSYQSGNPGWVTDQAGNRARWVNANTVTYYDQYGQQAENKDALGRFSAALFDFNGELPAAVASNAMNREVYATSFEDSFFTPGIVTGVGVKNVFQPASGGPPLTPVVTCSHSGNYSIMMPPGGLSLAVNVYAPLPASASILTTNNYGEYNLVGTTGTYPNGFEPLPGKKYLFDVWVKDSLNMDKSVNVTLNANNSPVTLKCKALVEDWKLLEGTIDLSGFTSGQVLTLNLSASQSNVYLDDIRIVPVDGQMKTYAYDDKTMRLMAELDENGFATFYEYDDEGLLIRVKKETERGVMTIKESRSSYKKTL